MRQKLGPTFDNFSQSLVQTPPVSIRYNTKKRVAPDGHAVLWCPDGRYLSERPSFTRDPHFHAGAYYVQEASSMLLEQAVRQSMDLDRPVIALDLCAAPGGKSTHLLSMLSDNSLLISNEAIRGRSSVLLENIEKWGYDNVIVTNNDPEDFGRVPGLFDMVLVDAPCSGEGLFRKEPEALTQWSVKNVEMCSLRQRRILEHVWPALKPGGILVYSTCTYNEKENLENLVSFSKLDEMEFISLALDPRWGVESLQSGKCIGYQCFPHRVQGEGFFLSVFRKTGERAERKTRAIDKLRYPSLSAISQVRDWITEPATRTFFLHGRQIRMLPTLWKNELTAALQELRVLEAGTAVGEIMNNKIIPHHALALSVRLRPDSMHRLLLDKQEALAYLRKDPITTSSEERGFCLIDFQGLGLGWVNLLPNRLNNLYPASRRIRLID